MAARGRRGPDVPLHAAMHDCPREAGRAGHAVDVRKIEMRLQQDRRDGATHEPAAPAAAAHAPLLEREHGGAPPLDEVRAESDDYRPVNCEFHDVLEAWATRRQAVRIEVQTTDGGTRSHVAVIADVVCQGGAEYLRLHSGETIRLDRLVAVGSVSAAQFGA